MAPKPGWLTEKAARAMPMHVVQELTGHSNIRTAWRFYVQVEPQLMQRACRALEIGDGAVRGDGD